MLILEFQGPKLKRMWQAQFLSHTLVILEYEGFFIDVEMILVTFLYTVAAFNLQPPIT